MLGLEWRRVDFTAGEVRLDPDTPKNDDGRTYPFTHDLRRVLDDQRAVADALHRHGVITPLVFHRDGKPIRDFRVQTGRVSQSARP